MKKNFVAVAILATLMTMPMTTQAADNRVVKLDINRDGYINAVDASIVLTDYAMTSIGKKTELNQTERFIADYDKNNIINAIDASGILETYAHNSVSEKAYPITKITFEVQIKVDNDVPDSCTAATFEECLDWIKADRSNRTLKWNQEAEYSIIKSEKTVGSPYGGGHITVYIEAF